MNDHRLRQGHHEPRNLWEYPADTPPESKSGHCAGQVFNPDLAAEIVAAVNAARDSKATDAVNAVARIRELHKPVTERRQIHTLTLCGHCQAEGAYGYAEPIEWPCPTIRAIDGSDDE